MSLPAVVQHLKVLEHSGLVKTEKVGRVRTCTIDTGALSLAEKWINDRRIGWEKRLDRQRRFSTRYLRAATQERIARNDHHWSLAGWRRNGSPCPHTGPDQEKK